MSTATVLRRQLNLLDAVSIGLGAIIGAGIFVLVGIAAGLAGPAVLLAVVLSGVSATFTALSFAELGSALPKAGGIYEYGHTLIHPLVGFLMGWMWVSGNIVLGATASQGFGYYLTALAPQVDFRAAAAALVVAVTAVNILGAKLSARVNNVLVAVKVAALLFLVAVGVGRIDLSNFHPFAPKGFAPILEATALFYFAYIGFPRIAMIAEEVVEPERNIPRAILTALWTSATLYLLVTATAVGVAGWQRLSESNAPLEDVARMLGFSWIVGVGGLFATLSVVLTSVMGQSRVFFAMARNGEIPKTLSKVHPRLGTPVYTILLSGAIMLILVLSVDIKGLAMVTSFLVLLTHVLTNVADVVLWRRGRTPPFAAPLRPLHAILGAALSLVLAFSVEIRALVWGFVIIAAGAAWYYAWLGLSREKEGLKFTVSSPTPLNLR
ncbi:MAG: amino acid permease [Thermofilaceae archaeon]